MNPTKTTNRLHFEDLDPHRFEDLCYELLKRLHTWKRLDPIGAMGSDGGIDIAGVTSEDIPFYCQVKRYQRLEPKDIKNIIDKIVEENQLKTNATVVIMTACDISATCFDIFYRYSKEKGFSKAEIYPAKKIETMLYSDYPNILEKYFGVEKKKKRSSASLIKKNLQNRKMAEDKLYHKNWMSLSVNIRIHEPWKLFVDSKLTLLSSKASLAPNRYGTNDASWMVVYPIRMHEGGIEVLFPLFQEIIFNLDTNNWHIKQKGEETTNQEVTLMCQLMGVIPYYQIVEIEEYDEYYSNSIIHCEAAKVMDIFSKIFYTYHEAGEIIFDVEKEMEEIDTRKLKEYIKLI